MIKQWMMAGCFLLLFVAIETFSATSTSATLTLQGLIFPGTVPQPPGPPELQCIINNGSMSEVSFGTIITDKIDGINYLTDVPLTLDCSGVDPSARSNKVLTLKYSTNISSNSTTNAIATSIDGLGIELLQNGVIFRPYSSLDITENTFPTFKAVPVKQPGKVLPEGNFEAFALLTAEYE